MNSFEGKVVEITGAGSGIGRALAVDLADRGARLALSDIDTEGLAETVREVQQRGAQVRSDRLDVSERDAVLAYADDVVEHCGVVNGTKAFLPHVIASGEGSIVNISSLFGLIAVPGQSAYNAAKFAVRGFTEALRQEMLIAKHPVRVTCVHPGGIKTAVCRNGTVADGEDQQTFAEFFDTRLAWHSPEMAARTIVAGVAKGHARVVIRREAKALDILARVLGSGYQRVVAAGVSTFFPWAK